MLNEKLGETIEDKLISHYKRCINEISNLDLMRQIGNIKYIVDFNPGKYPRLSKLINKKVGD